MKAKKQTEQFPNQKAAKKSPKMKAKVEEITRWESEGGAFIPTGQLPNTQQVAPDSSKPDASKRALSNKDSFNNDKVSAQR